MSQEAHIWAKLSKVKAFVFDVDGVLTDGKLLVTESGELLRSMNVRDGLAMKKAIVSGYQVHIITGGSSQGVKSRLAALGCHSIHLKAHDKLPILQQLMTDHNLLSDDICYVGDDLPDIPCIQHVAVGAAPADAAHEVLEAAEYISKARGGRGVARELIEKVMRMHGKW